MGLSAAAALLWLCACGGRIADLGDGAPYDGGLDGSPGDVVTIQDVVTFKDVTFVDVSTCGYTICNGLCVDTTVDDTNCGQCGHVCPPSSSCSFSVCQCTGGLTLCNNACVDTTVDKNNCGACGHVCGNNNACVNGGCQTQSSGPPPQGACTHSLCDANNNTKLVSGCDPTGCVSAICNADSYCCTDFWDNICVGEVATYCSPYGCP